MFSLYNPALLSSAEQEVSGRNPDPDKITNRDRLPQIKRQMRETETVSRTVYMSANRIVYCGETATDRTILLY